MTGFCKNIPGGVCLVLQRAETIEAEYTQGRTLTITRLPPRDFDLRKRLIGNSGAFFCSAKWLGGAAVSVASSASFGRW